MAYSLSQTTQQSGLQYSPSISGGGSSIASPTVQINPTPVDSFANDIDALLGSTLKASKAYFDLSDDATKMIAADHLVRYKEGSMQIDGDTSLTPEQKKVKLGELNASLNGEIADKIMNNDRAKIIYDTTYSNNARVMYAQQMAQLDGEIEKRDIKTGLDKIQTMASTGIPVDVIFNDPTYKTLLSKGKVTQKDVMSKVIYGIQSNIENEYNQAAINGGNLVQDTFMHNDKYNPDALKQYVASKFNGMATLDNNGNLIFNENTGTAEERQLYSQAANTYTSKLANEAIQTQNAIQKEKDRVSTEEARNRQMLEAFKNAMETKQAIDMTKDASFETADRLDREAKLLSEQGANDSKIKEAMKQAGQYREALNVQINLNDMFMKAMANTDNVSMNAIDLVAKNGYKGQYGDVSSSDIKNYLERKSNDIINEASNNLVNAYERNNEQDIIRAQQQLKSLVDRTTQLSFKTGSAPSVFKTVEDYVNTGNLKNVKNSNELLSTLSLASYYSDAMDKPNKEELQIKAATVKNIMNNTKDKNEAFTKSLTALNAVNLNFDTQLKADKVNVENLMNGWTSFASNIGAGTNEWLAKNMRAMTTITKDEDKIASLKANGKIIDIEDVTTALGEKIKQSIPFTNLGMPTNVVKAPNVNSPYDALTQDATREALSDFYKKTGFDRTDYTVDTYIAKNGLSGLSLINKNNPNDIINLSGKDLSERNFDKYVPKAPVKIAPETLKPIEQGNLDVSKGKTAENSNWVANYVIPTGDGYSAVVPAVDDKGNWLSRDNAMSLYLTSGKHYGIYKTLEEANARSRDTYINKKDSTATESIIPSSPVRPSNPNYGKRADGTEKGTGWLGELKMKDGSGNIATEVSVGVEINGKETQIPTIVPTLSKEELDYILKGGNPIKNKDILRKAIDHARKQIENNKSPYWQGE